MPTKPPWWVVLLGMCGCAHAPDVTVNFECTSGFPIFRTVPGDDPPVNAHELDVVEMGKRVWCRNGDDVIVRFIIDKTGSGTVAIVSGGDALQFADDRRSDKGI